MFSNRRSFIKFEIVIGIGILIFGGMFIYSINSGYKTEEIKLGLNEDYLLSSNKLQNGSYYDKEDWSVISVDNNGKVTGLSEGLSIVYLKNKNGEVLRRYVIYVEKEEVKDQIQITNIKVEEKVTLKEKETYKLKYNVEPEEYNEKIIWTSQNEDIVTVDSAGKILGIKKGEAVIEANVNNGEYIRETKVIVVENPKVENNNDIISSNDENIKSIEVNKSLISIGVKETYNIVYTKRNVEQVIFVSNNEEVAVVKNGIITGLKSGKATITIMSEDRKVSSSIIVYVEEKNEVESITLSQREVNIIKGETYQLKATILPILANQNISWTSDNVDIVTVSNGKVTGLKVGSARVTATSNNGKQANCIINVVEEKINIESIALNKTSLSLEVNATETLIATINPSNAVAEEITWTSSNIDVATVNNGKIIALKEGTATVTAKTVSGKQASANVTVKNVEVESITIKNGDSISLNKETILVITPEILPNNASNKTITWTSSDSNIVSINSSGKVTCLKEGTAIITAKSHNGKTDTIKIMVVDSVRLSLTEATLTVGGSIKLDYILGVEGTTDTGITFTSQNSNIATVDNVGNVKGISSGVTVITVKTSSGKTATCNVTVKSIATTSVTLNQTAATLNVGSTITLIATILPEIATNQSLTWLSSNISVATVDSSGKVTGIKAGTATITVKTADSKVATCTINVKKYKIALIGNSKTFFASLIDVFKNMAANGGFSIEVTQITASGMTLSWHSANSGALINKSYDMAVLQEQTDNVESNLASYQSGALKVANMLRKYNPNVQIYLRQTWPLKNNTIAPNDLTQTVINNAASVATSISATVIPDGSAWRSSISTYSSIELYDSDGRHQSIYGSYLTAACMYKRIFKASPTALTYYGTINASIAQNLQSIANNEC